MSDLISRQAAIEAISYSEIAFYPGDNEGDCLRRDSDIKQAIMELPSAQPEIIRCKDCAKREQCRTSTMWAIPPKDDWYCADAERRSND